MTNTEFKSLDQFVQTMDEQFPKTSSFIKSDEDVEKLYVYMYMQNMPFCEESVKIALDEIEDMVVIKCADLEEFGIAYGAEGNSLDDYIIEYSSNDYYSDDEVEIDYTAFAGDSVETGKIVQLPLFTGGFIY